MKVKYGGFDPKEFEVNCQIQKMFVNSQLSEVPLFEVEFFFKSISGEIFSDTKKQQFFFYQGKWRNTNPESELGAITFEESQIRSIAWCGRGYYVG
jgi:hypothetical protein